MNEGRELQEVSKEVVGSLFPLTLPLFVRDILRRFLQPVLAQGARWRGAKAAVPIARRRASPA